MGDETLKPASAADAQDAPAASVGAQPVPAAPTETAAPVEPNPIAPPATEYAAEPVETEVPPEPARPAFQTVYVHAPVPPQEARQPWHWFPDRAALGDRVWRGICGGRPSCDAAARTSRCRRLRIHQLHRQRYSTFRFWFSRSRSSFSCSFSTGRTGGLMFSAASSWRSSCISSASASFCLLMASSG